MSERFEIVQINPNDTVGGGGCLCSESKVTDCKPPYAVFFHQEMASGLSPHAVVCARCAEAVTEAVLTTEPLAGGEPSTAEEVEEEIVPAV